MKSSNHKLLNAAYTLHLIITILLALGGVAAGITYAVILHAFWILPVIWAGTFIVVSLGYVLGRLFLDMADDIKAIKAATLKNAAVRTSAPQATYSIAVPKTDTDNSTAAPTVKAAAPSVAKAADNDVASSTDIARQQKTLQLKAMLEKGAITQEEYEEKTKEYEKKMKETYTIE